MLHSEAVFNCAVSSKPKSCSSRALHSTSMMRSFGFCILGLVCAHNNACTMCSSEQQPDILLAHVIKFALSFGSHVVAASQVGLASDHSFCFSLSARLQPISLVTRLVVHQSCSLRYGRTLLLSRVSPGRLLASSVFTAHLVCQA